MGCLSSSLPPYVPAEVGLCSFCDWIYQRCKLDGNEKHRNHERRIVLFLRGIIQQEKTIHLKLTCQQAIDPLTSVSLNLISLIYSTSKVFLFCSPKTIGDNPPTLFFYDKDSASSWLTRSGREALSFSVDASGREVDHFKQRPYPAQPTDSFHFPYSGRSEQRTADTCWSAWNPRRLRRERMNWGEACFASCASGQN